MMLTRGSFQGMKTLNKSLILKKILKDGPISRAQIAKETMLTPPTVGTLVKELIRQRLVMESEQGESQGGRKPTMLVIDYEAFYIIGIDGGPTEVTTVLANLKGDIFDSSVIKVPLSIDEEGFMGLLKNQTQTLMKKHKEKAEKTIAIGIAMHGVVDSEKGLSLYAPNLGLHDMPVKKYLETAFSLPVFIENDARAIALAETWFGQGKDINRLLAVNIGTGVGAGVVINGELYRGDAFIAGEIGHMTLDLHGVKCSCGNYGCFQTLISGPAIKRRALTDINKGKKTSLNKQKLSAKAVFDEAEKGDALSIATLEETGVYMGIGLTNVIHTLNPDRIILQGGVMHAHKYLLPIIKQTVKRRALTDKAKRTEIYISDLGDFATAKGGVALVLVEVFNKNGEWIHHHKLG